MEDLPQAAPPGQLEAKCTEAYQGAAAWHRSIASGHTLARLLLIIRQRQGRCRLRLNVVKSLSPENSLESSLGRLGNTLKEFRSVSVKHWPFP